MTHPLLPLRTSRRWAAAVLLPWLLLGAGRASAAEDTTRAGADGRPPPAGAALAPADPYTLRPSVMLGLMQWVAFGGGNIAAQVKVGRWVFEYSHGQALQLDRAAALALTQEERAAGVAVSMPWTTGGGIGFQITPQLHVLLEAKLHRYQVRDHVGGEIEYTSFTLGPGIFYDIYLYKGLFLQPNLRWWPTVASSYDAQSSLTATDGSTYHPERHDLMPFVNVNLGWTFLGV
ncbi:MAG TPA: hypothetical protein VNN80_06005 [Polyangiaceae bacterium]|nr:hypothetical protein [Polyangiaceae bacterium]